MKSWGLVLKVKVSASLSWGSLSEQAPFMLSLPSDHYLSLGSDFVFVCPFHAWSEGLKQQQFWPKQCWQGSVGQSARSLVVLCSVVLGPQRPRGWGNCMNSKGWGTLEGGEQWKLCCRLWFLDIWGLGGGGKVQKPDFAFENLLTLLWKPFPLQG